MPTPVEIIGQHCDHLVRRLTSRSPLLRFKPASSWRAASPHDLFPPEREEGAGFCTGPDELLRGLLGDNEPMTVAALPPKTAKVYIKARADCRKQIVTNNAFFAATGNWQLYFAYPFVHWQAPRRDEPYWAPLFFWKIRMSIRHGRLTISRLGGDDATPIFNRMLAAALERFENLSIEPPERYRNEDIPWQELPEVIRETLSGWHKCEMQGFTANKIERFAAPGGNAPNASLHSYAAFGFAPFTHQSILEDLDRLSKYGNWDGGMGCMGILVSPAKNSDNAPAGMSAPDEDGKYIVAETDPSQENAIWKARDADMSILQGPPGTGKSQTIVNLIADALRRDERVAVVCHQRAALSVVKKRLDACGLGDLALLITSPQSDRRKIIADIKDIGDGGGNIAPLLVRKADRNDLCRTIQNQEKALENFHGDFRPRDILPDHRYGALRATFDRVRTQTGIDIFAPANHAFRGEVKRVFPAALDKNTASQREKLDGYLDAYNECDYGNHPWQIGNDAASIDDGIIDAALRGIGEFFDANRGNISSLHRSAVFAEHPFLLPHHKHSALHYAAFSSAPSIAGEYAKWLADAQRALSCVLPPSAISQMFREFRVSGESQTLEKCRWHLRRWSAFLQAREFELGNGELVKLIAARCLERNREIWLGYFDAAVAWNIYSGLLVRPSVNSADKIQRAKDTLADAIGEKKRQDAQSIVGDYKNQGRAAQNLKEDGLLRITGSRIHRQTELRDIYRKGGENMFGIYPVLLATPDAACQMLPLNPGFFDLLVIDEASQVFTSDALPMLYRAKRAVISGDEMQMPPLDIFTFAGGDGYDDGGDDDETAPGQPLIPADGVYELLEAVQNARGIKNRLLVHYRAEARELIDYSNCAFYGNLEIPTGATKTPPFMGGRPINLVQIDDGEFDDGINRMEIREIIRQLRRIWSSAPDAPRKYSVGVIVFNTAQRDELNDALEQEGGEFRNWLADSRGHKEMFFVHSVEHVQGDERDIIIMGTTYGKSTKTFGLMDRKQKGRRRLNVAVTRAKQGMIVVSSLNIDRITNDDGGKDCDGGKERWFLLKYMQYARAVSGGDKEAINRVLASLPKYPATMRKIGGEPENEFEEQVGDFIGGEFTPECGYEVEYQVGESGFRIDIGVKKDGDYVCGVECDGAPYHSGWRARHRDIWRQGILESKGWNIVRVWSTDWFHNKETAQDKLKADIAKYEVGDFIRGCGYEVEYQVGESGFRIDIGVKKDGDYICGVECDGAPYHSGWRARHRDIWRQGILESKGWNIARVWSTDWFHNKETAQDKLKADIAKHAPQSAGGRETPNADNNKK